MQQEIERPLAEKRKIHSGNEFELCYIRHQYFRRVKYNPTAEEMVPYRGVIRYLSQRTFYTYLKLFSIVGMNFEDVFAIGNVHLVNFLGLFEIGPTKNVDKYDQFVIQRQKKYPGPVSDEELLSKNRANLTLFMKQRMTDLVRICKQKAKNIKGFRVDEFIPFVGVNPPPASLYKLLKDNEKYGYKRVDNVRFKAIKKRCKAKDGEPFEWSGAWYISVPSSQRSLTEEDLIGAGYDPHNNEHNLDPEKMLLRKQEEIRIDKYTKMFKNCSKEEKVKLISAFVEKNQDSPYFTSEITLAKRMLRTMGIISV